MYKVLIAEDDADIIQVLTLYLENEGYEVVSAMDGREAYEIFQRDKVDLGLFDIMMPEMSGYDLIRKVRETSRIPIIILSAKREDSDKIIGLDIGADDYLTKPFNPLEVMARIRAAIRRSYSMREEVREGPGILEAGDLRLDLTKMLLTRDEEEIQVTPTELKILILLMKNPGRVYTKAQIYEHLKGEYFESDENTLMVHISNLRDKIERDSRNPRNLLTVRGLGYKFTEDRDQAR